MSDSGKNREPVVYQANPLIESRKQFNMDENRIFYLGLSRLKPHLPNAKYFDEEFPVIKISAKEIIDTFGNKRYYSTLKPLCKHMGGITIDEVRVNEDGEEKFTVVPVFQKITFEPGSGLELKFNIEIKKFLLELENTPYTKVPLQAAFKVSTTHALRLLELLIQYKNIPTPKIVRFLSIDDIYTYLNLEDDAYKNEEGQVIPSRFKQAVIDRAVKEINKKTPYNVTVKTILKGRRTEGYEFTMEKPKEEIEKEKLEVTKDEGYSFLAQKLIKWGIKPGAVAEKLVAEYGERWIEHVLMLHEPTLANGGFTNPGGYLRKVIEDREEYDKKMKYWAEIDAAARMKARDDEIAHSKKVS